MKKLLITSLPAAVSSSPAFAHTSEQGFVLLLPTDIYISAGVIAVALTVLILAVLPERLSSRIFKTRIISTTWHGDNTVEAASRLVVVTSLLSLGALVLLVIAGVVGSHDPLRNLLPLSVWTLWWIGFVCLQGVFGNLWYWVNPWAGLCMLLGSEKREAPLRLPRSLGVWPGVCVFVLFSCFALADPAPEDPPRLAAIVSVYWLATLTGMLLFGSQQWLTRVECFTMLLQRMARLSVLGKTKNEVRVGLPGWQLAIAKESSYRSVPVTISSAVFTLILLAAGSFDGLNETFWWLAKIGVNPLEFPGRSSVIVETISGLLISLILLVTAFALCVWLGVLLANRGSKNNKVKMHSAFTQLSLAILPIALAYHCAHFLTAFMVNVQYAIAAATDPLQNGRDLLGIGRFYVTTGFFNTRDTVRVIWLTQAGAVVLGHIISVLVAHSIAARLWAEPRRALVSQLPLAMFMILYTLMGLWLLAAPRGA